MELNDKQGFKLNSLQEEAMTELNKAVLERNKGLIVMPTGTGKTFLAAQWFREIIQKNPNARLLFICHQNDILSQANDKEFNNRLLDFNIPRGYYNASEKTLGQVTFATVQTLSRSIDKIPKDCFDYIIVDEAHHYLARTFNKVAKYFTPKFLLGLTATPSKKTKSKDEEISILEVFEKIIYKATTKDAIEKGILSPVEYWCVDNDIDFSKTKWNGKYKEKDLNKTMCVTQYDEAIIKEYTETAKKEHGRTKTICFCASVKHAYRMGELFNEHGIKAAVLAGKYYANKRSSTNKSKRQKIINDFKNGVYDIIFVRDLFNEGVDVPDADCVMLFRPTNSSIVYIQQIGRGLRQFSDKKYLLVLDFIGNANRCDILLDNFCDMVGFNLKEHIINKPDDKPELIELNNGCNIRLSKRKYDVLRDAEERNSTKEKLIENYFNVKKKLSSVPTAHDMMTVSDLSYNSYLRMFGSWLKFKKFIKENTTGITKEQIKEQLLDFKKKNGFFPSVRDLRKHHLYSDNTIRNLFGSYAKCILELGGQPRKNTKLDLSKELVVSDFFRVKKELGKIPFEEEINNKTPYCFSSAIREYFGVGGYLNFLRIIGDLEEYQHGKYRYSSLSKEEIIVEYKKLSNNVPIPSTRLPANLARAILTHFDSIQNFRKKINENVNFRPPQQKVSENELIENFRMVRQQLGRSPTQSELGRLGIYSIWRYKQVFGSLEKFTRNVGETFLQMGWHKDFQTYLTEFYRIKKLLNKVPTFEDLQKHSSLPMGKPKNSVFENYGEGYNSFLKKIGEVPNAPRYTTKDLFDVYYKVKNKLGRIPHAEDIHREEGISTHVFLKHFGSYLKFLKQVEPNSSVGNKSTFRICDEQIILKIHKIKDALGRTPTAKDLKNNGFKNTQIFNKRFGSYDNFLKRLGLNLSKDDVLKSYTYQSFCNRFLSNDDIKEGYFRLKKALGRQPTITDFNMGKNSDLNRVCSYHMIKNRFGTYNIFLREIGEPTHKSSESTNLTLIPNYTPKNPLPPSNFQTFGKSKHKINAKSLEGFKYVGSDSKMDIRQKIIEKIQDGDTVLMLESPELSALKEIERQGKKPKKIIIPNHIEFDALATALQNYKTDLTIEVVNTSALQYLVDHEEETFNFVWLDYCGAFSYYTRDLDILFQRKAMDMKLFLTYNIFDPKKQDDSYYFTKVISYVHKKVFGKSGILLMEDVSQRYKKNMFSVGFDIKHCGVVSNFEQKDIVEQPIIPQQDLI